MMNKVIQYSLQTLLLHSPYCQFLYTVTICKNKVYAMSHCPASRNTCYPAYPFAKFANCGAGCVLSKTVLSLGKHELFCYYIIEYTKGDRQFEKKRK